MQFDEEKTRLLKYTLKKMRKIADGLVDNGVIGYGRSLMTYIETLSALLGLENEGE